MGRRRGDGRKLPILWRSLARNLQCDSVRLGERMQKANILPRARKCASFGLATLSHCFRQRGVAVNGLDFSTQEIGLTRGVRPCFDSCLIGCSAYFYSICHLHWGRGLLTLPSLGSNNSPMRCASINLSRVVHVSQPHLKLHSRYLHLPHFLHLVSIRSPSHRLHLAKTSS